MRHTPRVLIIDRRELEPDVLAHLSRYLPAEVVVCSERAEAARRAWSEPFDVIVLDILAADLASYDLCRTLKSRRETADTPVLFAIDIDREGDLLPGFQALAFDHVERPYIPHELRARVQAALRVKALLDEMRIRVRSYERCLRIGRELAEVTTSGEAERIVYREIEDVRRTYDLAGLSLQLEGHAAPFATGDLGGAAAAEIPLHHSRTNGMLRVFREYPCDEEEVTRLSDIAGTLVRGICRNSVAATRVTLASV